MKIYLITVTGLFLLVSCSRNYNKKEETVSVNTPVSKVVSAAISNTKSRKFIRSGDIRFKVKDVIQTSRFMEDLVTSQGGYIAFSKLKSTRENIQKVKYNTDSSITCYQSQVINEIKLRIPDSQLDNTLRKLEEQALYLDYKNVSKDDVTSDLLKNVLSESREQHSEVMISDAVHQNRTKKEDVLDAISLINRTKEAEDAARLNKDILNNQMEYSTVQLYIYQEPQYISELSADIPVFTPYETPFMDQLSSSLMQGLGWMKQIVLFFSKFWTIAIVLFAVWMGIKLTGIKWNGKTS